MNTSKISHTGKSPGWSAPSVEELQSQLPQYEVLDRIGRGGMGAVYRARQKSLKRLVAIKILPAGQADVEMRFAERFKNEAYAMARLNHPNIVNVHDAGETPDGLLYFVMEYVEGRDLAHEIAQRGRLPQAEVKAAALQVVEALAYAHANGIVHRDIKPANILLDAQGRVKVADFGLAKLDEPMVSTLLTKSGTSMGTADFMAPETRQPGSVVDARADLFSLGVTIYQMLTGELPRGMFKLPSELRPDVDPHWDEIIWKSLEPVPEDRYQTAAEMRGDLERISLDGSASPAPEPDRSHAAPAAQPVRKTKISGWLMIAFVVAAALGVSALWITKRTPPSSEVERLEWTDWLGPKLADPKNFIDKGWLREEGGLSTERELAGTSISSLQIADVAVRVRYLIRDSNGVQITVRDCGMGGRERGLYVAHDTGVSVYIGRMDTGGQVRQLANKLCPAEIKRDAERTLEFRCVGTSLTATLNGVPIVAADDATLQDGALTVVLNRGVLVKGVEFAVLKEPRLGAATFTSAALTATKELPFVNSLSMKFVPVPIMGGPTDGQRVLFSIWETRVRDYETFVTETKRDWRGPGQPPYPGFRWPQSNGAEPAIYVSWLDATAFAEWLTMKERAAGRIDEDMAYRLPLDHEWTCAAGLGSIENPATPPKNKIKKNTHIFPWGEGWPPPAGVGNFADETAKAQGVPYHESAKDEYLDGYDDSYAYLAPVGSFRPSAHGLHDLAGNLQESCQDWFDASHTARVTRGSHWGAANSASIVSSWRGRNPEDYCNHTTGFRLVLAPTTAAPEAHADARQDAPTAPPEMASTLATTLKDLGVEWQDMSAEARVKAAALADLVVEEEVIRRRSRKGPSIRLPLTPPSWRDYAIRITHVGDAQIDLRYSKEGFYFALCQSAQFMLRKQPAGSQPGAALLPSVLHPAGFDIDKPHELVAIVQGDRIRSWIDGRLVCDVRDSSYAEGGGAVMFVPQTQLQRVEIFQLAGTSSPP